MFAIDPKKETTAERSSIKRRNEENEEEPQRKKQKADINEKQRDYSEKLRSARPKTSAYNINEVVSIKIDKVDKSSPLHPNVLIGKIISVQNTYATVVTMYGKIDTQIAFNRLNKCSDTNVKFDYSKEIKFSPACKKAGED